MQSILGGVKQSPKFDSSRVMENSNIQECTMKCYLQTKPSKVSQYKNVKININLN